jgi:dienelactone hydrolase
VTLRILPFLILATLAGAEGMPPQPVTLTFRASDGSPMDGRYYPPLRRPAPAVLCFHGLGRDPGVWGEFPARLQAEGYAVFAVTLRGHLPRTAGGRKRGQGWVEMELPQFADMAKDVDLARACLLRQREVDQARLALLGEEFGANLSLAGAKDPGFRAAILLTPRQDARGLRGPELLAAYGERPCLAVASADDPQGAVTLEALKAAATGSFEPLLLPPDPSSGDLGAAMLADEGKKGLQDRVIAWLKAALPPSSQ